MKNNRAINTHQRRIDAGINRVIRNLRPTVETGRFDSAVLSGRNRSSAPKQAELPILNPNFVPKPGIGTKAITPPNFGVGIKGGVAGKSRAALMIDGKVYVHHHHLAAQQLAGKAPKPGDLYGFATLDELGNVIRVDWVPIKP